MTGEQMERAIEFLFDHQAQFAADISILKESQAALGSTIGDLGSTMGDLEASLNKTNRTVDRISMRMEELAEVQVEMKKEMALLAKQQARTSGELEHFMIAMQGFVTEVRDKLSK